MKNLIVILVLGIIFFPSCISAQSSVKQPVDTLLLSDIDSAYALAFRDNGGRIYEEVRTEVMNTMPQNVKVVPIHSAGIDYITIVTVKGTFNRLLDAHPLSTWNHHGDGSLTLCVMSSTGKNFFRAIYQR